MPTTATRPLPAEGLPKPVVAGPGPRRVAELAIAVVGEEASKRTRAECEAVAAPDARFTVAKGRGAIRGESEALDVAAAGKPTGFVQEHGERAGPVLQQGIPEVRGDRGPGGEDDAAMVEEGVLQLAGDHRRGSGVGGDAEPEGHGEIGARRGREATAERDAGEEETELHGRRRKRGAGRGGRWPDQGSRAGPATMRPGRGGQVGMPGSVADVMKLGIRTPAYSATAAPQRAPGR
jgi:hypothetical protein